MPDWRITKLRGKLALTYDRDGRRHRYSLGTSSPSEARQIAPAIYAELTKPAGRTVADLWKAYESDKEGRAVLATMKYTWKALEPHFGSRDGDSLTVEDCRSYTAARRKIGRSDGAIHTELGHLRTVLKWAERRRLIERAPDIERPKKPPAKQRYLTRDEADRIIAAAPLPHVRLAMKLMLGTAARISALLELTWDRVDFKRGMIHLTDPDDKTARKARATIPMNDTVMAALTAAQRESMSNYVIEWGGKPVKSIKKAIATAAEKAGLDEVSPHVFRHTAAVWMVEAGIPLTEVAQFLGHSTPTITYKVYARYSPDHLRIAARALELPAYEVLSGTREPPKRNTR